ncbi:MAG TPA: histidine phosphatase family protein [Steroidobacteraceae bacterium]|jgi:alpha-ribazole phosphatase|nr:histidine phosphatase family protein [Steroidobacteraceae bacterium]
MLIYLIRHAEGCGVDGLCYGRQDIAVAAAATAAAARDVRTRIPAAVLHSAPIYTSPLSRCTQLARELAAARAPIVAAELIELDFGSWEGRQWHDLPRSELDAWADDVWGYRAGGGESAEAAACRWRRWVAELPAETNDAVLAVTHAGVIRVALAHDPLYDRAAALQMPIAYGSVHTLVVASNVRWIVAGVNG